MKNLDLQKEKEKYIKKKLKHIYIPYVTCILQLSMEHISRKNMNKQK